MVPPVAVGEQLGNVALKDFGHIDLTSAALSMIHSQFAAREGKEPPDEADEEERRREDEREEDRDEDEQDDQNEEDDLSDD